MIPCYDSQNHNCYHEDVSFGAGVLAEGPGKLAWALDKQIWQNSRQSRNKIWVVFGCICTDVCK